MANLTTIDSNQLVEHDDQQQQQQQHAGQLLRQTVKENPTTSSGATEISATITTAKSISSKHSRKYNQIVVETLEQQLLIELNSGDKRDMIIKNNNKMMMMMKKKKKKQEIMEFRQIELIYRAEGNANLVLALPQFKKVLRLPKSEKPMIKEEEEEQQQEKQKQRLQTKQSTPHVVEKVNEHEEEMAMAMVEKDDTASEVLEEDSLTMQYQNTSASSVVHQNAKELTMHDFAAYMEIIRQIVGQAYVLEAKIVSIPKESDRNWLNEQIRPHRPVHRLDKEFHGHFGLLLPDATLLPLALEVLLTDLHQPTAAATLEGYVYAIEIKTKQGWLLPSDVNDLFDIMPETTVSDMNSSSVSGSNNDDDDDDDNDVAGEGGALNKLDTRCRYCIMQFLKLKQNKIDRVSSYCPMDLFSGNAIRMLKALDALFECPQNNLRLYRNGRLIYGDHANTMSCQHLKEQLSSSNMELKQLKQLLMVSLLRDYTSRSSCNSRSSNKSDKAMVVRSDVVKAVSSVGQVGCASIEESIMLSKGTTETEMAQAKAQQLQINEAETQCLPKNCVLQQILHLQLLAKQHLRQMSVSGYVDKTGRTYDTLEGLLNRQQTPTILNDLKATEKYMLGATALDCSIIIAFQEIKPSLAQSASSMFCQNILELPDVKPRCFLSKVSIIDLDPKPDSHFHKYLKQTKEAITATASAATSKMAACSAKDPSD